MYINRYILSLSVQRKHKSKDVVLVHKTSVVARSVGALLFRKRNIAPDAVLQDISRCLFVLRFHVNGKATSDFEMRG